jgi:hypothetical protein
LMFLVMPAGRNYYGEDGTIKSSTGHYSGNGLPVQVTLMGPEWLHSIENTDDHVYHVIRILFVPEGQPSYYWPAIPLC